MRRMVAFLLCLATVLSLTACGSKGGDSSAVSEPADTGTHFKGYAELSEALGYEMLRVEDDTLEPMDYAMQGDDIGVITYSSASDSTVTLKMTVNPASNERISILSDASQHQGGVSAPSKEFSPLNVYVDKDAKLCFCSFTYTKDGYTGYLNLSETNTDFHSGFSDRLIGFVEQLYQSKETPGFVAYLDNIAREEQAAAQAEEDKKNKELEAKKKAEEAARQAELKARQEEQRLKEEEEARKKAEAEEKKRKEEEAKKKAEEEKKKKEEAEKKKAEEKDKSDDKKKDDKKKDDKKTDDKKKDDKKKDDKTSDDKKKEETTKTEEKKDTKPAGKIKLKYYDITLVNVGDAYTCEPKSGKAPYTWKSADKSVAKVNDKGTITAVGSGETTVTVTSKDNYQAKIVVRVP